MSIDALLSHFDRLIQTPEAVSRLRRFILDLAVRGRLVPQDPGDEPAAELLKRIAAEKARLVKAGEIKKQKLLAPVEQTEQRFNLPSGWSLTRLDFVTVCLDYMREPINKGERTQRIAGKSPDLLFPYFGATQQQGWIDNYIFDEELVLLGEDGVPFFDPLRPKAYLINGKSWVNNHAHVFRGIFISHPYLVHWLNTFDYSGRVVGATRAKLNQARAVDIPIMLPPLAEQRRIVAKVDELMGLCDRLEAAQTERETTRNRLAAASLARLNAPDPDPATFRQHVAFALDNFTPLTTRPEQVKALRQTILNLAVRGRLVPQDPGDEPAAELLKRIAAEKARLVKAGEIKGNRAKPTCMADAPFELPRSWKWAALCDLFLYDAGAKREPKTLKQDLWLLELEDVEKDVGRIITRIKVAERESRSTKSEFRVGDILYGKLRPYLNKVIVADKPGYSTTEIVALRPYLPLCSQYCALALRRPDFVAYVTRLGQGTKMPRLRTEDAVIAPFPLPPLAEQRRVVAKVDELMGLCDRLEGGLATGEEAGGRLVEAMLHGALDSECYP